MTTMIALSNPTDRRRGQRPATLGSVDPTKLHRQAALLVHSRWPRLDPDDIARRVVLRYRRERPVLTSPDDLSVWIRSAAYQIVVDDQRLDRGNDQHHEELTMLLREIAGPRRHLPRELLHQTLRHLLPRDITLLRLRLLGYSSEAIAARVGVPAVEVDRAYDRGRARLRAVIAVDDELSIALHRAWQEARATGPRTIQRPRARHLTVARR